MAPPIHDRAYKFIFAHAEMVLRLLLECGIRIHIPAHIINNLLPETLQSISSNYVSDDSDTEQHPVKLEVHLVERVGDKLWRIDYTVTTPDGKQYRKSLYIPIEFQSEINGDMHFRIAKYVQMAIEDMRRRGEYLENGEMPLLIPIVVYCGDREWVGGPGVLGPSEEPITFEQRMTTGDFALLDMQHYAQADVSDEVRQHGVIFKLAQLELGDESTVMTKLLHELYSLVEEFRLADEEKEKLRTALYRRAVELRGVWDENGNELSFDELDEAYKGGTMEQLVEGNYEKRVIRLCNEAREEALEEGIGRGREEGQRQMLRRQAMSRFDADTAERLAVLLDRIDDPGRLEDVGEWIVNGYTKAEFLRRVEGLLG